MVGGIIGDSDEELMRRFAMGEAALIVSQRRRRGRV
jgi:hypothetical protein